MKNNWKLILPDLKSVVELPEPPKQFEGVDEHGYTTEYHKIPNTNQYISTDFMWECILEKYKEDMKDMYDHGYPEGRLIPSTHYSDCEEAFKDAVKDHIITIVNAYLDTMIENS